MIFANTLLVSFYEKLTPCLHESEAFGDRCLANQFDLYSLHLGTGIFGLCSHGFRPLFADSIESVSRGRRHVNLYLYNVHTLALLNTTSVGIPLLEAATPISPWLS